MDKYEYKLRSEEIKDLISQKEYVEAMEIADTIDWRRVKNISMLTMVSDLYKINRRYDVSRDILLLAYDRYPTGRTIVYSLCELSVKLGEFVQAVEYYKEFVRIAPNDTGRYILKYKLYDAQEVSLEERIGVLEEFKSVDYREKWAYELAFLYHRAGLERQCVAECDELILTFGEGKYVVKAMELKMLHQPLTPVQQETYDNRNKKKVTGMSQNAKVYQAQPMQENPAQKVAASAVQDVNTSSQNASEVLTADTRVMPGKEIEIQVKTLDVNNKYNTMNIQAALADSMKEIMANEAMEQEAQQKQLEHERLVAEEKARMQAEARKLAELEARKQLEAERLAEEARKQQEAERLAKEARKQQEAERLAEEARKQQEAERLAEEARKQAQATTPVEKENSRTSSQNMTEITFDPNMDTASLIQNMAQKAAIAAAGSGYDNMLSMENDGQISLVVPEEAKVEKQITGQMSIEDILSEWEKMKKASDQRSMNDIKQRVLEQTGEMFTEFDKNAKSGLLAGLEDEGSNLSHLPIQPKEPAPIPKTEAELLAEAIVADDGLEGEDLPEVEELAEVEELVEVEESAGEVVQMGAEPANQVAYEQEYIQAEELPEVEELTEIEQTSEAVTEDTISTLNPDIRNALSEALEIEEEPEKAVDHKPEKEAQTSFDTSEMMSVSDKLIEQAEREATGGEKQENVSRALTEDEKELFGALIQTEQMKDQIAAAIDAVSLASYTGNVIITGEAGSGTLTLAKNLIKSVQMSDSNFSGKVAKISGAALDKKDIPATLSKLRGGALIVEKANGMSADALKKLTTYLEQDGNDGIIVIMEDTKIEMRKCINKNQALLENFNARIDINAMDNDALVAYARDYAYEQEYSIDDLGILALYTRISDLQTGDHSVTLAEVREIVEEGIWSANRKNVKHFFDILSGKRYDDEDMIVLREKDFVC